MKSSGCHENKISDLKNYLRLIMKRIQHKFIEWKYDKLIFLLATCVFYYIFEFHECTFIKFVI